MKSKFSITDAQATKKIEKMKPLLLLVLLSTTTLAGDYENRELGWLVGCWVTPDKSAQEVWVAESDGSLAGFSVAIDNGKVGFYEVLSIKQSKDGLWTYTAHPVRQESASFPAVEMTERSVVFANPQHDYPQQIKYKREGDQLYATISLIGGKNPKSFDKVACD